MADAEPALASKMGDMRTVSAALRDDGDRAGRDEAGVENSREGAVIIGLRVEDAEAIWAKNAHLRLSGDGCDLGLDGAPFFRGFGKAGRKDDGRGHAALGAFAHGLQGRGSRHGEDRHIRRFGQAGHRAIGLEALHIVAVRVHRIDRTLEAAFPQVTKRPATDPGGVFRRADDGNRAGIEKGGKRITHVFQSLRLSSHRTESRGCPSRRAPRWRRGSRHAGDGKWRGRSRNS